MNKVELEARLESLTDEINFLRQIYDEVNLQMVLSFFFFLNMLFYGIITHYFLFALLSRRSVSFSLRSRTPQWWWRWTTAGSWTWMPLWLRSVLSMRTLPVAAVLKLKHGTSLRYAIISVLFLYTD